MKWPEMKIVQTNDTGFKNSVISQNIWHQLKSDTADEK